MPTTQRLGADVEIVEPYTTEMGGEDLDDLPCIKPRVVRVNGVDVGLLDQDEGIGVELDGRSGRAATVTLKLLVRSVTIKAE